jgi:hypothetical protein
MASKKILIELQTDRAGQQKGVFIAPPEVEERDERADALPRWRPGLNFIRLDMIRIESLRFDDMGGEGLWTAEVEV